MEGKDAVAVRDAVKADIIKRFPGLSPTGQSTTGSLPSQEQAVQQLLAKGYIQDPATGQLRKP